MKTTVVETAQWARELQVEVSAERIESELSTAYRRYQKRIEIPGFRKGHAPLNLIRTRYGDTIRGEVISDLLPTFVQEAAREAGLVPASPPRIAKLEHEPGQTLTFTAEVDIWPEVAVDSFDGLEVTRAVHEVGDDEIDGRIKSLQERHATESVVERPLAAGDILIADLQRIDEGGSEIIGERFEERRFLIGEADAPSPEFESALVGISAGESRDVGFTYRSDLPNERLAGTSDRFRVLARQVRQRALPPLDDDFAKDVSAQFTTFEELRQHVATTLRQQWDYMAEQRLRTQLADKLIERYPIEVPEGIVNHFLRSMHEEEQQRRGRRGERAEAEHDHAPSDEERQAAGHQLRRHLLIDAVRKQAGIEVTDEEFEALLVRRAEEAGVSAETVKRSGRADSWRREMTEERVFALLLERAQVSEEKV